MEDIVSYQFAQVKQRRDDRHEIEYELILRQQPKQSRMCGIGEKADRRPIDPPPIIQLKVFDNSINHSEKRSNSFLQNPYFFMYASLVAPDTDEELHLLRDGKTRSTTGSVVSSLYHLKDIDNSDAGFFVFPDLSVRMEGTYRLKLSLFEIIGREVYHCKSILSEIFTVYSAKRFPGMEESTFLSRSFADQGLKIRIRKEIRIRRRLQKRKGIESADASETNQAKRPRGEGDEGDKDVEDSDAMSEDEQSPEDNQSKMSVETPQSLSNDKKSKEQSSCPSSPRPHGQYDHIPSHHYDATAAMYSSSYVRPHPWHDREYMGEHPPHYPPYYDPYDRRYPYHPYPSYYHPLPPVPEGVEHRYAYPSHYARPPIYSGYYDHPRMQHASSPPTESSSSSKPYSYESPSPYAYPRGSAPWSHHYGDRPPSREETSPHYRTGGPMSPPATGGHSMYPYPPYYGSPYPPPPPPAKQEHGLDPTVGVPQGQHGAPNKIQINDLLTSSEHQSQNNESGSKSSSRPPYGAFSQHYNMPPPRTREYQPYPPRGLHESYTQSHLAENTYVYQNLDSGPPKQQTNSSGSPAKTNEESSTPRLPSLSESQHTESARQSNRNADYHGSFESPVRQSYQGEPITGDPDAVAPTTSPYTNSSLTPTARRQSLTLTLPSLVQNRAPGTPTGQSQSPIQFQSSIPSPRNSGTATFDYKNSQIHSPLTGSPPSNRGPMSISNGPNDRGTSNGSNGNIISNNGSAGQGIHTTNSSPRTPVYEGSFPSRRPTSTDSEADRNAGGVSSTSGSNGRNDRYALSGSVKAESERYTYEEQR